MNIIVFGDSIAWGAFDHEKGGWVERLKSYLFDYECFVYNCSVSGNTSADIHMRMGNEINSRIDKGEEIGIIIAVGANDCGFDNEKNLKIYSDDFESILNLILSKAKAVTKNICFVGLTPIDDSKTNPVSWDSNLNYSDSYTKTYNDIIKSFCQKNNVLFADVRDRIKKEELPDGCHLYSSAHEKICDIVRGKIAEWYLD
jgi:lysophospholipase L1-like esterase